MSLKTKLLLFVLLQALGSCAYPTTLHIRNNFPNTVRVIIYHSENADDRSEYQFASKSRSLEIECERINSVWIFAKSIDEPRKKGMLASPYGKYEKS